MSDTTSLSQLVKFIGQSGLPQSPPAGANGIGGSLAPRLQRRGVGDLLGVVLALSARTRRMVLPQVSIDLDVFSPSGNRAVRIVMGGRR